MQLTSTLESRVYAYIKRVCENYRQKRFEKRESWWDDGYWDSWLASHRRVESNFYADVELISSIDDWSSVEKIVNGSGEHDYMEFDSLIKYLRQSGNIGFGNLELK